jgi:hypothetical protein
MRRAISVVLALGLLTGAFIGPAEAGKKKKKAAPVKVERVVEYPYTGPGIGASTLVAAAGYCYPEPTACAVFAPEPGEKYIKIEVTDATGTTIAGSINQGDLDGDGIGDLYGEFCGAHEEPLELLNAEATFQLSMYSGTCYGTATPSPSVMTQGVVKITFSNLP